MTGRIYSCGGGAPNQPSVAIAANVFWSRNETGAGTWLQPQVISVERAYFAARDISTMGAWIGDDRKRWRDGVSSRKKLPVAILVDASQSPAAPQNLEWLRDEQTMLQKTILTAGNDNPFMGKRIAMPSTVSIGARFIVSYFDSKVAKEQPKDTRHSRPYVEGRVVLSMGDFEDGGPPLLSALELRASLSAAESLMARASQQTDTETLMSLSADEVTAATFANLLTCAEMCSPSADFGGDMHFGQWDSEAQPDANFGYVGR
nr:hypothetical protein [uncultured Ruegeria sp.]